MEPDTERNDVGMVTLLKSEFLYENAPFPSCHASTLVETSKGELLAAWFGGTAESAPDVVIYLSRLEQGKWSAPARVADGVQPSGHPYPCYNPVLFEPKPGLLLLFYKVGTGPSHWWGMMIASTDGGRRWTKPERLPDGILGPIKNKPLLLPGLEMLCPSSTENEGCWRVHFERTRDFGRTWQATEPINDGRQIGAIQPSLLVFPDGRLRAIGRTQQGRLFAADSSDRGRTWGTMRLLDVPNPNSGTDAVTLRDGRFLLVYNNTPHGRTPLNVALSTDGEHWNPVLALEEGEGEYSYPAVIQTRDGRVHITYTWRRQRIRHAVLNLPRCRDLPHRSGLRLARKGSHTMHVFKGPARFLFYSGDCLHTLSCRRCVVQVGTAWSAIGVFEGNCSGVSASLAAFRAAYSALKLEGCVRIETETGTTITGWVTVAESKEPSEAGQTEAVRLTLASRDAPSIVRS